MSNPLYNKLWLDRVVKPLIDEYTDRLTPEVSRADGYERGVADERARVLKLIRQHNKKPSQALLATLYYIEAGE